MTSWPLVIEGDGDRPDVIDEGLDDDLVYARPPELVAWGTVDGIPWRSPIASRTAGRSTSGFPARAGL